LRRGVQVQKRRNRIGLVVSLIRDRSLVCSLAVVTAVLGGAVPGARGGTAHEVEPVSVWVADGTVSTIAATPSGVFVGGDFSLLGRPTGSWVAVTAAGTPIAPRPVVEGEVSTADSDGSGGWFLRGPELVVDGVLRHGVVHLRRNGRVDPAFKVVSNGSIESVARVGATLYVTGSFSSINGKQRMALAAVDARTGAVLPWSPRLRWGRNAEYRVVSTIAPTGKGGTIYFAGDFARVNGARRAGIAAVDVTGRLRPFNAHPDAPVSALAVDVLHNMVYLAGDFGKVNGSDRAGLAAVDGSTGRLQGWNPDCDGTVNTVRVSPRGSPVYVAGEFAAIGGKSRRGLAAVDARRGAATPWDPNIGGAVQAMLLEPKQKQVVIGGEFASVGDADRANLAAVDLRTGIATPWDPKVEGVVGYLGSEAHGAVRVGGDFVSVGALPRDGLAELSADGRSLLPLSFGLRGPVRALAADPVHGRVYVGGRFTFPGEKTAVSLATIDPASGALAHWGPSANSGVWAIAPTADGSTVYLGGAFATLESKTRRRLGAVDANGALLPFNAGANGIVHAIVPAADVLYVAGEFGTVAGEAHRGVAVVDAVSGKSTGWDAGANDTVFALALAGDALYVAGDFDSIGGKSRNGLAALDAGSATATRWDPGPNDAVRALAITPDGSKLVVAGDFTKIAGGRRDLGEFDLATGFLTTWNPDAPFFGTALAYSPDGGALYFGGDGVFGVYR
jgi:trimeric autotransporter adhesin